MSSEIDAIREVGAVLSRRGWIDDGATALQLTRAARRFGPDPDRLRAAIPSTFLVRNNVSASQVLGAVGPILREVDVDLELADVLLPIDAIDTFAKAVTVDATRAIPIAQPLELAEADVKRYIARIIGEPYLDQDWGGELSDLLTARVELRGRRVSAAFLLKGSGTKGELTPRRLGKNADQIRRLGKQHADLYVVQHVGKVAEATRDQLRDMVSAIRFREGREAVGSVWDGVDCARLFLAHGLIVEPN